jgi:hypothetical protein
MIQGCEAPESREKSRPATSSCAVALALGCAGDADSIAVLLPLVGANNLELRGAAARLLIHWPMHSPVGFVPPPLLVRTRRPASRPASRQGLA